MHLAWSNMRTVASYQQPAYTTSKVGFRSKQDVGRALANYNAVCLFWQHPVESSADGHSDITIPVVV